MLFWLVEGRKKLQTPRAVRYVTSDDQQQSGVLIGFKMYISNWIYIVCVTQSAQWLRLLVSSCLHQSILKPALARRDLHVVPTWWPTKKTTGLANQQFGIMICNEQFVSQDLGLWTWPMNLTSMVWFGSPPGAAQSRKRRIKRERGGKSVDEQVDR